MEESNQRLLEQFDIIPEVEKAAIALVEAASIKQVNLQVHLSPYEIMVNIDKGYLGHILLMLLSNVIRLIPNGSVVSIHANDLDGSCIIEIINKTHSPIGMEKLDKYFSRVINSTQSDLTINDLGMGFSIAKQLTEEMGGLLNYESNVNVGNYFKIKFQLA
ncbi:MAG: Bacteriophytochrome [Bacteroidota bacterium]|jgi:signal transduction histidine kinase